MNELHNVDKKYNKKDNEVAKNLITQSKEQEKKEDLNKVINHELDEQKSNFKKKLEAKKRKKMLNISGVEFIAQAGGSVRDDHVIMTCDKYGIAMTFTGVRLFHH